MVRIHPSVPPHRFERVHPETVATSRKAYRRAAPVQAQRSRDASYSSSVFSSGGYTP